MDHLQHGLDGGVARRKSLFGPPVCGYAGGELVYDADEYAHAEAVAIARPARARLLNPANHRPTQLVSAAPVTRSRERAPRSRRATTTKRARAPGASDDDPSEPSCAVCDGSLADKRRGTLTCSAACRKALSRAQKRPEVTADVEGKVWRLVRDGEVTGWDALAFLTGPQAVAA